MSASDTSSTAVKPLTKRTKETQELYRRREEVDRQIEQVYYLRSSQILELFQTDKRQEPNYLLDETIVYLLRERRAEGDKAEIEALFLILNSRIWQLLNKFRGDFINQADFEDLGQEVIETIVKNVFDLNSDKADYAQINFGDYVITEATGRRNRRLTAIVKNKERFVTQEKDDDWASVIEQISSGEVSLDRKLMINEAINKLPDNLKMVAVLLADGWKIESKNESEPTIAKYLGVTPRTIRNWVNDARELLYGYKGELS